MDVGCGFMIIHSGCMTSFSRSTSTEASSRTFFGIIKRNLGLFLLGIIRLLATTAVSYDVPVEEYGVHWNFFMSLGMTKLGSFYFLVMTLLLLTVLPDRMLAAVPLGIMIPLELVIYYFDMVRQFPRIARTNVLTANKEGIIAIPNSISMFFIGYLVTRLCANLYKEKRQVSSAMVALGYVYFTLLKLFSVRP
ncbi:hypothetical protein X943_000779 [Babesia divergens]|uniref:GPI-anchored wall transfer protein 1 n=1 Tax=Babesia divergens TaxID=32595 RepID=A0AAD9GKS8_BABDI|nr:hypothetical protein X943_000779 [Babesia divergens]